MGCFGIEIPWVKSAWLELRPYMAISIIKCWIMYVRDSCTVPRILYSLNRFPKQYIAPATRMAETRSPYLFTDGCTDSIQTVPWVYVVPSLDVTHRAQGLDFPRQRIRRIIVLRS